MKQVNVIKKIFILIFVSTVVFVNSGCESKSDKVPAEKIAKVYVDLLVTKELHRNNPDTLDVLEKDIFARYGIDSSYYKKTLESFKDDKTKWDEFFKIAKSYLDSLRKDLTKQDSVQNKKKN